MYLGGGKPYSIREVADMIERNTGKKLSINWGAVKPREMDTVYACAPTDKCLSLIGWEPQIMLEDEIKQLKF